MFPLERPTVAAAGAALLLLMLTSCAQAQRGAKPGGSEREVNLFSRELYATNGSSTKRTGRIFQFIKDDTAIRVELSFAIPFLTIPVGGKSQSGALVDVNLGALAAGGVFTVAAMLFIPHLFEGLSPQIGLGRSDEGSSGWSGMLSRVDHLLKEQHVDAGACAQRAVCSLAESAFTNLQRGTAGSMDKILDGVVSNEWLTSAVKNTFVGDAINRARYGGNCTSLYNSCPLSQKKLKNVATNIAKFIKS